MSALDAAAKVLATAKQPMTTGELIEAMAARGYWKSPGGQTPDRTLYLAIKREIQKNGKDSRFKKVGNPPWCVATWLSLGGNLTTAR
jgi:hypothetical protein